MSNIRARILASFGVALLVIGTGWVGASSISISVETRTQVQQASEVVEATLLLERDLERALSSARGALLAGDPAALAAYRQAIADPDPLAALVDRVAAALRGLRARERGERDRLRASLSSALGVGRAVILGGSLLAVVLAVVVNLGLMRALRDREVAQRKLVEQAAQLQRQTDALVLHDQQLAERLEAHQQLSAALQRSNEELDRFAYTTSHDLKTPLRGIVNIANFIEEDLGEGVAPEVRRNLALMRSRARRLEALIDGILAYSRAGRVVDKPEHVEVPALLSEVVELIAPPEGVEVSTPSEGPRLLTERVPLQQILMNLVQNAIKHGCPGERGRVVVEVAPAGARWRFSVRDFGPGIAPQFHQRIFGIFQSLAPRDVVEGSGIGLAVVKRLVESRGGEVGLSSSPGTGATFSFEWPAA